MFETAGLDIHQLGWFVLAGWLLNLTPGPDVLYIVTQSLSRGVRAGLVAGLGITTGCFVHVAAAALGLSALLAASSTAFTVLKWLGAAYLLWMGVRMLLTRASRAEEDDRNVANATPHAGPDTLTRVFFGGFMTNVLNPKVALFFLAFVPQFIPPGAPDKALAFALLGTLFNLNAIPVDVGYALLAAWTARRMGMVQRGMRGLQRAAGLMFIGFGVRLAMSDNPTR